MKLKKIVSTGATTEYAGNYVYENGSLKFFNQPEGYIEPNGSDFDYIYQYKDHLGNIRLSYKDVNRNNASAVSLQIQEENNYYPFGLKHEGYNNNPLTNHRYRFSGKEEQDDNVSGNQLNWLDFHVRNYDAALGRWMNVDPLADSDMQFNQSPFAYTWNNPVNLTDPTGMHPDWNEDIFKKEIQLGMHDNFDLFADEISINKEKGKSSGNCVDENGDPIDCNSNEQTYENALNELDEVWISNKWKSEEEYLNDLARAEYWRKQFRGFALAFEQGSQQPGGTGVSEFWSGFAFYTITGSLALPMMEIAGVGGTVNLLREKAIEASAYVSYQVIYRATSQAINTASSLVSRSAIGYTGQRYLMTYGKEYVNFGRAALNYPSAVYTGKNFNYLVNRYTDIKRLSKIAISLF